MDLRIALLQTLKEEWQCVDGNICAHFAGQSNIKSQKCHFHKLNSLYIRGQRKSEAATLSS